MTIEIGDVICIPYTDRPNSEFIMGVVESYGRYGSLPVVIIRIQGHDGSHITVPMPNSRDTEKWIVRK